MAGAEAEVEKEIAFAVVEVRGVVRRGARGVRSYPLIACGLTGPVDV